MNASEIKELCEEEIGKIARLVQPLKEKVLFLEKQNGRYEERIGQMEPLLEKIGLLQRQNERYAQRMSELEREVIQLKCNHEAIETDLNQIKKRKSEQPLPHPKKQKTVVGVEEEEGSVENSNDEQPTENGVEEKSQEEEEVISNEDEEKSQEEEEVVEKSKSVVQSRRSKSIGTSRLSLPSTPQKEVEKTTKETVTPGRVTRSSSTAESTNNNDTEPVSKRKRIVKQLVTTYRQERAATKGKVTDDDDDDDDEEKKAMPITKKKSSTSTTSSEIVLPLEQDLEMPFNNFIQEFVECKWNVFDDDDKSKYIKDKIQYLMTFFGVVDQNAFDSFYAILVKSSAPKNVIELPDDDIKSVWDDIAQGNTKLLYGLIAILIISRLEHHLHPTHPTNVTGKAMKQMLKILYPSKDDVAINECFKDLTNEMSHVSVFEKKKPHSFLINAIAKKFINEKESNFIGSLKYIVEVCAKTMFSAYVGRAKFNNKWTWVDSASFIDAVLKSQPIKFHAYRLDRAFEELNSMEMVKLKEYGENLFDNYSDDQKIMEKTRFNFLATLLVRGYNPSLTEKFVKEFDRLGYVSFGSILFKDIDIDDLFGKEFGTTVILYENGKEKRFTDYIDTTSNVAIIKMESGIHRKFFSNVPGDTTKENNKYRVLTMDHIMLYQCMEEIYE